jgi:two-component system, OmpR family, response regulator
MGAYEPQQPAVLLVEDHSPLLALIVEQFQEAGFRAIWAGTGEDAIWLMERDPGLEVLVTDIRLAGTLDGWDVAERFRALKPTAPVVYTTGYGELMERPVRNSIFVKKPFKPTEIVAKIQQFIDGGAAGAALDRREETRPLQRAGR